MNLLIDSHCHFDFPEFDTDCDGVSAGPNRDTIWQRCQQNHISQLIIPGVYPSCLANAIKLSEKFAGMYFSVGLHPWWVKARRAELIEDDFLDAVAHSKCVAIGECGLDQLIDTPIEQQLSAFEWQLRIAKKTSLPVIIHNRKANGEIIQLLDKYALPQGGVIHGFSGSKEMGLEFFKRGFLLGIGGTITYERARKTRQAAATLPLEALLLETDAPDMPLSGAQGKRNSPENIIAVLNSLKELRSETAEQITQQTTSNAQRLFALHAK